MLLEPGRDPEMRATKIVEALAPSIRSAIAAELASMQPPAPARTPHDRAILDACRAVGAAVDRLEQMRFAGTREAGARQNLEKQARRLRELLGRARREK